MNSRVLEILDRLETIGLEEIVLRAELREILAETEKDETPDFSMCSETTQLLLSEMWHAHGRMLSHHDIKQDVMYDENAEDTALRMMIARVKKELRKVNLPYEIINIKRQGYKLANVTQRNMTRKKTRKQG